MALAAVYEKGGEVSLYGILRQIKNMADIDNQSVRKIDGELKGVKCRVTKVLILRNKVFGHMSPEIDPFFAIQKAGTTGEDFKILIETAVEIFQMILTVIGSKVKISVSDIPESGSDTKELLDDLL